MSACERYPYAFDYDDAVVAEAYDRSEIGTEDVDFIVNLLHGRGPQRILGCFCRTGRIIVPPAGPGHRRERS